jgi:hypothetical protein
MGRHGWRAALVVVATLARETSFELTPFCFGFRGMSDPLSVEVREELIVVTRPGTSFSATYGLERDNPNILLLAASADPKAKPGEIYQFRADAFGTALRKARELGWIVWHTGSGRAPVTLCF